MEERNGSVRKSPNRDSQKAVETGARGEDRNACAPPVVDARGQLCPVPLLLARRAIDTLPPGARVLVVGDDPDIPRDFEAWCGETGHRLVALDHEKNLFRVLLERAST